MTTRKYKTLIAIIAASTAFAGVSCSDDDEVLSDSSVTWDISGNTVVDLKPERDSIIYNPLNGWVLYTGIGDGLIDDFWDVYDNFPSSAGTVNVSDYSKVLYIRGVWSDFNPEEGKYVWQDDFNDTDPAVRFKMLVEGAEERGMKLAFTFITDSRDKHHDSSPDYVKEKGAEGFDSTTGSVDVWTPYPDDPIFQECYENFLRDFAAEFGDPDRTAFVSGFGLGKWGETHSLIYSTGDETPRWEVFEWISDLMADIFTEVPIVINFHRCLLTTGEFTSTVDEDTEPMIESAVDKGFSLRHDAFGMKTYYTTWEKSIATAYRGIRPVIAEGGWVKSSHGSSITGDGYADYSEVRQGEFEDAEASYANMMDFRYSSDTENGETYSWFNDAYSYVKKFIAEGGYRLYPDKISAPTSVSSGGEVKITHRWSNLGWGYCPTNIPQWEGKYKVTFALLNTSTLEPEYTFTADEAEPSEWIKDTPTTYTTTFNLTDVAKGEYTWAVGIVDTTKDEIGINIAVKDQFLTDDGWVMIENVTVK